MAHSASLHTQPSAEPAAGQRLTAESAKFVQPGDLVRSLDTVLGYRREGDLLAVEPPVGLAVDFPVIWYRASSGLIAFGPAATFSFVSRTAAETGSVGIAAGDEPKAPSTPGTENAGE